MTNGNDPNDDAGNRALDYATNNVEKKLAGMDLEELCEEFGIGLVEGLEAFDAHYRWNGFSILAVSFLQGIQVGGKQPALSTGEIFSEMLCTAIRADKTYQQQMSEKLQGQHRAGEE